MSHKLVSLSRYILLLLMVAFTSNVAKAQLDTLVPNSPELYSIYYENPSNYGIMTLTFMFDDEGAEADGFNLYLGTPENGAINYQLLYTIPDSLMQNRDSLKYLVITAPGNLSPGTYYVYIAAYNEYGESNPSNVRTFEVINTNVIVFDSEPPLSCLVNAAFPYTAHAVTSDSSEIRYRVGDVYPQNANFTIDEITGIVNWTPTEPGWYSFDIEAYLADNSNINTFQYFTVYVTTCETPGVLICSFVTENNEPENGAWASIYSNIRTVNDSVVDFPAVYKYADMSVNQDGNLYVPIINAGYYWIESFDRSYRPLWYSNASSFYEADSVYVGCGDTVRITIVIPEEQTITFSTEAPTRTMVNQPYVYQANAVCSDSSEVHYRISSTTDMTIDSLTGVVTWTPTEIGWYDVYLEAYSTADPYIMSYQWFQIEVSNCEQNGVIICDVVDEDNYPVRSVYAHFYSNVRSNRDTIDYYNGKYYYTYATNENNTQIITTVGNAGYYWFYVQGKGFEAQWYANSTTIENADSIYVGCGDTVRITMVVHPYEVPEYFTVSGSVVDATNNNPVPYALVEFYGTEPNSNNKVQTTAYVDPITGEYSVSLLENFEYLAYCFVLDTMGMSTQYLPQYYYLAADPTTAERFVLTGDKDNVNFLLNPRPNYSNSISGIVQNVSNTPLQYVYVVAYLVGTDQDNQDKLYIGRVDCSEADGTFYFDNLIPGEYVIFAFPMDRETYFPGYYLLNAPVVMSWMEATRITVTEDNNSGPLTVILVPRPINGYKGGFEGYVKQSKKGLKAGSTLGDGTAIAGANVFATDMSGNKLSFGQSDVTGKFEVSDLKKGKYVLYTDKVGFESQPVTIELEDDNKIISTDLEMLEATPSDVEDNPSASTQGIAYPNPAADQATLFFTTNYKGNVNISMFNSIGDVVLTNQTTSEYGLNKYTLNLSNIQNGMYFVKIENGNDVQMIPLVVKR